MILWFVAWVPRAPHRRVRAAIRYGARRAAFVTLKDGFESVFSLDYNQEYRRRVEAVCDCKPFDLARYGDQVGDARLAMEFDVIRDGFRRMTGDRARRLARDFGATHLVVEASQPAAELGEVVYRDPQRGRWPQPNSC